MSRRDSVTICFRNNTKSASRPRLRTFPWPLSHIPLLRTVTCQWWELLVSLLHAAVSMTVPLMKPSPRGLLMGANCCWARGSRLDRDRCSSLPLAATMQQAAGLCVCVCVISVYMSVCVWDCEGEQMAPVSPASLTTGWGYAKSKGWDMNNNGTQK